MRFWREINERLDKLANRLDAATRDKITATIAGHVPIPAKDECREAEKVQAAADAQFKALARAFR